MKKLLTLIALFVPVLLFSQQKSEGFITKYHFLKISPSLLAVTGASEDLPKENLYRPGIFTTIGGKISRYAAVGLCAGYFNLSAAGDVVHLGADFTFTNFEAKKSFPVIFAQLFYAPFNEKSGNSLNRYSAVVYDIKGKYMYNVGAGYAFPAFNLKKIAVSLSYSRLISKAKITTSTTYPPNPTSTDVVYRNEHQNILMLSLSFIL